MRRIARRTKVKARCEAEYDRRDLLPLVEVVDHPAMRKSLRGALTTVPCQARTMAELIEVTDGLSGDDADLSQVWDLP